MFFKLPQELLKSSVCFKVCLPWHRSCQCASVLMRQALLSHPKKVKILPCMHSSTLQQIAFGWSLWHLCVQEDNTFTALGTAMSMVGGYFSGGRLLQSGSSQLVRTWAVVPPGANMTIILLNKALTPTQQVHFISALRAFYMCIPGVLVRCCCLVDRGKSRKLSNHGALCQRESLDRLHCIFIRGVLVRAGEKR